MKPRRKARQPSTAQKAAPKPARAKASLPIAALANAPKRPAPADIPPILFEADPMVVSVKKAAAQPQDSAPLPVALPPPPASSQVATPESGSAHEPQPPVDSPNPKSGLRAPANEIPIPGAVLPALTEAAPQRSAVQAGIDLRPGSAPNSANGHWTPGSGSGRLFLTARDPHCLYAYWDVRPGERDQCHALSRDGQLVLRWFEGGLGGTHAWTLQVARDDAAWFLHVPRASTLYGADLGYWDQSGVWHTVAASGQTLTPPEWVSEDMSVKWGTLPQETPLPQLLDLVQKSRAASQPLLQALEELRAETGTEAEPAPAPPGPWTPAQERVLAELSKLDELMRTWLSSVELPRAALSGPKAFWLNVNAELVIYGTTDPEAKLSVAGRQIQLRPDGTFSLRMAFPDGTFELPVKAVSADGQQMRGVQLSFRRATTAHQGPTPTDE